MSALPPTPDQVRLEDVLRGATRRLALLGALQRAGWVLLLAVGALELAWWIAPAQGLLAAGLALAALLAVGGALWLRREPRAGLVAAVVDARLERGGLISAAAESATGQHTRFRALVQREAARALEGWTPRRLVPLRVPPGLWLGGAAVVLLPVLLGGRAVAAPEAALLPGPPSLLAPDQVAAAVGGDATGEPAPLTPQDELTVAPGGELGEDPLAAFAPELAEVLRERLRELAEASGVGGGAAGAGASESPEAEQARRALAAGQAEPALQALQALAQAAAGGDRAAQAALEGLAKRAGAGAGAGQSHTLDPVATGSSGAQAPAAGGRRGALPLLLEATRRRYFSGEGRLR